MIHIFYELVVGSQGPRKCFIFKQLCLGNSIVPCCYCLYVFSKPSISMCTILPTNHFNPNILRTRSRLLFLSLDQNIQIIIIYY